MHRMHNGDGRDGLCQKSYIQYVYMINGIDVLIYPMILCFSMNPNSCDAISWEVYFPVDLSKN